jgi:hypothetical protein
MHAFDGWAIESVVLLNNHKRIEHVKENSFDGHGLFHCWMAFKV